MNTRPLCFFLVLEKKWVTSGNVRFSLYVLLFPGKGFPAGYRRLNPHPCDRSIFSAGGVGDKIEHSIGT